MRRLILLALFLPLAALAKSGGHGGAHGQGATQSQGSTHSQGGATTSGNASHGGGMHNRMDPHKVPPLAGDRKVHEQDCTKPIDWSAGNVKCR